MWSVCPNGCGEKIFHMEMTSHCQTKCRDRLEQCSFGCGELVKYRERDRHKMHFCAHRFVQCKYAPECKWTGLAKHLQLHIDDTLTVDEKQACFPDDPHIECLERPFYCWHPPLIPSAEFFLSMDLAKAYNVGWVGCGACIRFGDRAKHMNDQCPMRLVRCPDCELNVIGSQLQEHMEGKPTSLCRNTLAWVESGCLMREVPCMYIVNNGDVNDKSRNEATPVPKQAAKNVSKRGTTTKDVRLAQTMESGKLEDSIVGSASGVTASTTRVEQGCNKRIRAKDLVLHQQRECSERFIYCRHGCGAFLKWRHQNEHEDKMHLLQTDLHLAALDGDLERVKDHVEGRDNARKYAVNCRDDQGNNAVHYAILGGHSEVLRYLLAQKCDVNVAGLHGRTALITAAMAGNVGLMQQLLRCGAVLDKQDSLYGWTALHHACMGGHAAVVDVLLAARAMVNQVDARRSDSPLHIALIAGQEHVATRLADAGADVNVANNRRCKTFYHTFSKETGKPKQERRGDVAHDMARSADVKRVVRPQLDAQLGEVRAAQTLDPRFGITFETAAATRHPSPTKLRALGRSPSPTRTRTSLSPTRGDSALG